MKDFCAPASNGQCSCRKFGADPNACEQGVDRLVAALVEELALVRRERDHWRSNHAGQVARCALLRERPDLPVDRLPAYAELVRLQAELAAMTAMPRTPDEVIAFIGSHYDTMIEADDPANVRFTLSVHDLLSAFSWWQDA